jgi:aspartate-semialdehyde dehydrogenase
MLRKSSLIHLALVGATGAVGQEVLRVLEKRSFPVKTVRCFASERSKGTSVRFCGQNVPLEMLGKGCFKGIDIAIFCAGRKIAQEYAPFAVREGAIVVDNSSFFRMDPDVPLVIPEINGHALKGHKGIIANPNCSTAIMLMPLAPLHQKFGIKRIIAATYQAASGAGALAMEELKLETKAYLEQKPFNRNVFPFSYAFNLFTHNSPLHENGYVEEELKMLYETRKILEDNTIYVSATCVRVPILRAHSEALNVEFHKPITKQTACDILSKTPGVCLLEDRGQNRFPMPIDASGRDDVLCGRIREDLSMPNTLELWVVGDQLLKGAALNAVQIAEMLC